MQTTSPSSPRFWWLRELLVPALMIGGIGLYLYDAANLSVQVLLLPIGLIVVVVMALLWALVPVFLRRGAPGSDEGEPAGEDEAIGPILNRKAWLLVALPALLFLALEQLGALVALVALVFGAQVIFGTRSPARSALIAIAVTLPTYALFKYVLYARFPVGALGLG
jgi:hypothetical protein